MTTTSTRFEAKLDPSGRLGNTTQIASKNGYYSKLGLPGLNYLINQSYASETAVFTVTFISSSNSSVSLVNIWINNGTDFLFWGSVDLTAAGGLGYSASETFTFAAKGISLDFRPRGLYPATLEMSWFITVQAPPDATITFS